MKNNEFLGQNDNILNQKNRCGEFRKGNLLPKAGKSVSKTRKIGKKSKEKRPC